MSKSLYDSLVGKYSPEQPLLERKEISVKEKGVKYQVNIGERKPSAVFQIDGKIIPTTALNKCDKLLLVKTAPTPTEQWIEIFVELKGTDVKHGMEQLLATINHKTFESEQEKRARLVGKSFPTNKSNPAVEKLKRAFEKLGVNYKQIKQGQIDKL